MSEATNELRKQLEVGVTDILENQDFQKVLDYAAAFWNYSLNNSFLIASQFPTATHVAPYKTWIKLGRQVLKGEKGIKILVPTPVKVRKEDGSVAISAKDGTELKRMAFKVGHVFDITQTEGEEPPEHGLKRGKIQGEYHGDVLITLVALAKEHGSETTFENPLKASNALGYYAPADRSIHVLSDRPVNEMTKTMIHETAHALEFSLKIQPGERDYAAGEAIAEGAAYIVSKALGVDTDDVSFYYIARYVTTTERFSPTLNGAVKVAREMLKRLVNEPEGEEDDNAD
jgi:antirestriction protein ArdC